MSMESSQFGIFPRLLEPARHAAERLKSESITSVEVPDNPGLFVSRKADAPSAGMLFEFEQENEIFVVHE